MLIVLIILGAFLGSFAGAQVWRLRAYQLRDDRRAKEPVDMAEYRQLKGMIRPLRADRSECLSCHHRLAWYDLIPIVSWASLRGKCRYCQSFIGWDTLMSEVGLAVVFGLSYLAWPHSLQTPLHLVPFALWLIACTIMLILFSYDAKWSLLPFGINIALIVVAGLYRISTVMIYDTHPQWASLAGAVLILGGLYLAFSVVGWVGMGDGILGVGLALLLGQWELAFLTLFLANFLGCVMLVPLFLRKKLHRNLRIPFGPFLIMAGIIVVLWGDWLISHIFGQVDALINQLML